ncbi:hypothetical protein QTH19_13045 [Clostridium perfringens]|nr:hypothetical protein [Clostridium perfringens]
MKEGYVVKNYCTIVTLPKDSENSKDSINVFTLEEQQIFMKECMNNNNGILYILALGTGLRLGEILTLKVDGYKLKRKLYKYK